MATDKNSCKCAAIASVVLLTTGSAAWAQGYGNIAGNYGNQGYNQGYNPGYQGANAGNLGGNQAGWGQGMQGSGGQYSENTGAGYGSSNNINYDFAQHELAQYGYTDIHNLRPTQGWSADAMKKAEWCISSLVKTGWSRPSAASDRNKAMGLKKSLFAHRAGTSYSTD